MKTLGNTDSNGANKNVTIFLFNIVGNLGVFIFFININMMFFFEFKKITV